VRIPAKVDYAIRAMTALAAAEGGRLTAEQLADAQDIPLKFLRSILTDLSRAQLLRSHRGPDGGYLLERPANQITLANVYRVIDGRLVEVRDQSLSTTNYPSPAEDLPVVWMAVVAGLRRILETTTIADLVASTLPTSVLDLASEYRTDTEVVSRG
jgi:Rrf2 family protein